MAGEVCDGVHAHPLHSVRYLTEVLRPAIASGARDAGRDAAGVTIAVPVFVVAGDSDEELERGRQAVRRSIAFYGSTRTYRRVFELHGWESATAALHAAMARGDLDAMPAVVTDEMLDVYAVTARWDGLASAPHLALCRCRRSRLPVRRCDRPQLSGATRAVARRQ